MQNPVNKYLVLRDAIVLLPIMCAPICMPGCLVGDAIVSMGQPLTLEFYTCADNKPIIGARVEVTVSPHGGGAPTSGLVPQIGITDQNGVVCTFVRYKVLVPPQWFLVPRRCRDALTGRPCAFSVSHDRIHETLRGRLREGTTINGNVASVRITSVGYSLDLETRD